MTKWNPESHSNAVSILTNPPLNSVPVQEDMLHHHNKSFENHPEDVRVSKASEDAGLMRKNSRGQHLMTTHDMKLTGFGYAGSCREFSSSLNDAKGWIRGNNEIGPVLEVKVANLLEQYGVK